MSEFKKGAYLVIALIVASFVWYKIQERLDAKKLAKLQAQSNAAEGNQAA